MSDALTISNHELDQVAGGSAASYMVKAGLAGAAIAAPAVVGNLMDKDNRQAAINGAKGIAWGTLAGYVLHLMR